MQNNPYAELVNIIGQNARDIAPVSFRIGRVLTEQPISIDVGGAVQNADALVFTTETPTFFMGDSVLLLPIEEEQRYIALTRLVGI